MLENKEELRDINHCRFCQKSFPITYWHTMEINEEDGYSVDCDAICNKSTVSGGYGSKWDENTLYWVRKPKVKGLICDFCIQKYLDLGWLVEELGKKCNQCQKELKDVYFIRKGCKVRYHNPAVWSGYSLHYPYSDAFTLSEREIYWCPECGDKIVGDLESPDFIYPYLSRYLEHSKEYLVIKEQMKHKIKVGKQIKKHVKSKD